MNPERWAQIEELFHRAAECDPQQRTSLLDGACNGDAELRRAVEDLLASEESARHDMQAAVRSGLSAVTFPLVGETVSHYQILDGLGGGGMGLVYRAEDIKLGRQVALKFLPEESAKDPAALGRFEREARSASALEHPNICPIYEFGEHEGQPFLVMQLLEGQTLRDLISTRSDGKPPLELSKLLDLALQIADGLDAAHRHGIIHRDIKPANIFVTTQGQAKILDFGLAKLAARDVVEEESGQTGHDDFSRDERAEDPQMRATPDPFLSRTGVAMGTAGYMSPEQARGEKLDARTDFFSFGLVLYEMATGQRAFKGDTGPVLHEAILKQTPAPMKQFNPRLPGRLETIIAKALEKDRARRYQFAAEMRADLEVVREALMAKSPQWFRVGATIAVAILAGGATWFLHWRSSPALPEVKFRQLTINSSDNAVRSGSISPDGKYLAYVDKQGMHIKDLQSGATQTLSPEALLKESVAWEIQDAAWLPDSTRFIVNGHPASEVRDAWSTATTNIWSFSRLGSPPRNLRESAWSWAVLPDGSISFGTNKEHESWSMGPNGEGPHKLFDAAPNTQVAGPLAQSSADPQIILYAQHDASGDSVLARDLRGGPATTIFGPKETKQIPGGLAWLPDGRLIYQAADHVQGYPSVEDTCNFWTLRLDLHTGKPLAKPQRLTNWTGFCSGGMNVSADGKHVAFLKLSPGLGTAYVAELDAGGTRILNSRHFTFEEADDAITDWTADSKAVILVSNRADHYELYKQSLASDTPQLLASIPNGADEQANVSPDGRWIITQTYPLSNPAELNPISRVPINGGPPELILKAPELLTTFSCARPPSNRCVLADLDEGNRRLVVSNFDPLQGRGAELARFDFDSQFDWKLNNAVWNLSQDGTRFAVSRGPAGPIQVYSFKDKSTQLIQPKSRIDMLNLAWAADGKTFYFSNRIKDGMELLHMDLQGNTKVLWKNNARTFCVPSPSGRYLAICDVKQSANMWVMENF